MPIPAAMANPKLSELERKIADLTLLQEQLEHRIQQTQGIRGALSEQQNLLTSEITHLSKSLQIKTFQQAQQNSRVRYNVELLRTILTYADELDAKVLFYQNGRDRLTYLSRLAEDDIRMIAALNDLKIDALTTQISLLINRYLPEAHVIQIDPQRVTLISAQQAWERVANGK
ncbi:MAG: hypothetical protein WAU91_11855 [Desulfatitalea sp.]